MVSEAVPRFHHVSRDRRTPARKLFDREVRHMALCELLETLPEPSALWKQLLDRATEGTSQDIESMAVSYSGYKAACAALCGSVDQPYHPVLNSDAFVRFDRDGLANVVPLFGYLAKKILLLKLRLRLETCSGSFSTVAGSVTGTVFGACEPRLSQEEIEQFITEILPHIRMARDCPPWFQPYYVAHCSTRIMQTLDDRRSRSVSVSKFMTSGALNELLALYEVDADEAIAPFPIGCAVEVPEPVVTAQRNGEARPAEIDVDCDMLAGVVVGVDASTSACDAVYSIAVSDSSSDAVDVSRGHLFVPTSPDAFNASAAVIETMAGEHGAEPNWFSLVTAVKVYVHFCSLDRDNDGVLSLSEMLEYNRSSFTHLAISRLYEEHIGSETELLDYKQFLEFTHCTEYPGLRSSTRFFWKMLDAMGTEGYIHHNVLRRFCIAIAERLAEDGLMNLTGDSILSEVVDMIDPEEVDRIAFADLERSNQSGTVLPVMLDFRCFFNYDSREHMMSAKESVDALPSAPP